MNIVEHAVRIRRGQTTVRKLVEQCLDAISNRDDYLNAFITISVDEAKTLADRADEEIAAGRDLGPLHGIPISVKDIIDLRGLPTTAASHIPTKGKASRDAPALARLRQTGAIFIGKCNLHEFAFGTTGEISAFGPTRHPQVPGRMPGGSSSGSAVSVAAGMAIASIGTDTGGSIRIPSAACGVVGLKPTFGELSCKGVFPLAPTLDHLGPIGLTIADVGLVYQAMLTGRAVPIGVNPGSGQYGPVRLGLLRGYFLDALDPTVRTAFARAMTRLTEAGCVINEVEIPHAVDIATTYLHTVVKEGYATHAKTIRTSGEYYSQNVRERLEIGRAVTDEEYREAQQVRAVLRREVDAALDNHDALVLPTLPMPTPLSGTDTVSLGNYTLDVRDAALRLTQLFDLTGHPAITIPCGPPVDGLTCGLQLVGHHGRTVALVELGTTQEKCIRGY